MRLLSALQLVAAIGLLIVIFAFALDVVQLRGRVEPERLVSFQVGAFIAELKHLTAFVALVLLGLGGWKTATSMKEPPSKDSQEPAIVMKS